MVYLVLSMIPLLLGSFEAFMRGLYSDMHISGFPCSRIKRHYNFFPFPFFFFLLRVQSE